MTTKITVSLPDRQVAALKAAVQAGQGRSVSALVSSAVEEWQQKETLTDFLAHLADVHGPVPPADVAWAEQVLREA